MAVGAPATSILKLLRCKPASKSCGRLHEASGALTHRVSDGVGENNTGRRRRAHSHPAGVNEGGAGTVGATTDCGRTRFFEILKYREFMQRICIRRLTSGCDTGAKNALWFHYHG